MQFCILLRSAVLEMNGLPSRKVNRNGLSEKGVAFSSALVNDVYPSAYVICNADGTSVLLLMLCYQPLKDPVRVPFGTLSVPGSTQRLTVRVSWVLVGEVDC